MKSGLKGSCCILATLVTFSVLKGQEAEIFVPGGKELQVKTSPAVKVEPNAVYLMECEAKRCGSGIVLCGTADANLDDTSSWMGWKKKNVLFRTPSLKIPQVPRYGTYNVSSGAMFRAISLFPAKAEYAQFGDLTMGHGETLQGNDYIFDAQFGSEGRMDSRPLQSYHSAFFNSHRWCLNPRSEIIYRHELQGRRLLSGEVRAGAIHRGGEFTVEVSTDARSWTPLFTISGATTDSQPVPQNCFPTRELFVRIRGGRGCSLQLNRYGFSARVDGESRFLAGQTRYYKGDKLIAECRAPILYDTTYGTVEAETTEAVCWQASSGWKVARHRTVPTARGKGVTVCAAANESESVQLVVSPRMDLADVRVTCGELTRKRLGVFTMGRLPVDAVVVRRVGYVPVTQPTDRCGCKGDWPDPLPPQDDSVLPSRVGENQPFWITVTVPKGTPPGIYKGRLSVEMVLAAGGARRTATMPFAVEVFGFALPDVPTLKSSFGINPVLVAKWHHARTMDERRQTLARYHEGYSAYRISPGRPAPYDNWEPTWDKSAGADHPEKWVPVFNWADWDKSMETAFGKYHFSAFNMRPASFWGGFGAKWTKRDIAGLKADHPAYLTLMKKYLRGVGEHLKEKGWLDKAYIYWYDEPTEDSYPMVMEGMKLLKETMPGVKRLLTEQPEAALAGGADIWCPMPHYIHTPHEAERRAAGDEFWWYLCCEPKAPYFTEFIDHSGAELRLWGWASWRTGISGILMWETTYWTSAAAYPDAAHPQNPYQDPMGWVSLGQSKSGEKRPWGNGDGRFFYPPMKCVETTADPKAAFIDEPPVPSQRLALIRDTVEDYEYLTILKSLDPSNPLLTVPPEISVSDTEFNTDPAAIENQRVKIAREIERLSAGKGK